VRGTLLNQAEDNACIHHLAFFNLDGHYTIVSAKQFNLGLHGFNCQDGVIFLDLGTSWRQNLENTTWHR
jgi:hypothetical protein